MAQKSKTSALERAADIYTHYFRRSRELKSEGHKIVGYFCCYPPLEIMTALDILPIRIMGDMDETISEADGFLPVVMCVFYRSCFDLAIKKRYDFMDGFIGSHACDAAERVSHIWRNYIKTPCAFFLDIPHTDTDAMVAFFKTQLVYYQEALEGLAGKLLDPARLREAVEIHNKQRRLVRHLYQFRKTDPPAISGSEVLQTLVALMSIPVAEGNTLLKEIIAEIQTRSDGPRKRTGRLLVWGSLNNSVALTELIESTGHNIVVEDTAVGTRPFWHDIEVGDDPLDGIAYHYLREIKCPRTFSPVSPGFDSRRDIEKRFGYLKEFVRHWKVNGAYLNIIRNCDIHGYEVPAVREYLEGLGIPVLVVEHDYSTSALEPLRTRFQALAETIG